VVLGISLQASQQAGKAKFSTSNGYQDTGQQSAAATADGERCMLLLTVQSRQ
jgi:hypothetical protein